MTANGQGDGSERAGHVDHGPALLAEVPEHPSRRASGVDLATLACDHHDAAADKEEPAEPAEADCV